MMKKWDCDLEQVGCVHSVVFSKIDIFVRAAQKYVS